MATAKQQVFAYTDLQTEIWTVDAGTPKHTLVAQGDRHGVTIANATGVAGETIEFGPHSVTFAGQTGVGTEDVTAIAADAVGVALDGTWEFDVTGVTTSTTQGTAVYADGEELTTTETGTRIGVVHYPGSYVKTAGVAPIKIGA